jgi:hypothetical protein
MPTADPEGCSPGRCHFCHQPKPAQGPCPCRTADPKGRLSWHHPDVRTCGLCGHKRDVHGATAGPNGGPRCNITGNCECEGFRSIDALRYANRANPGADQ